MVIPTSLKQNIKQINHVAIIPLLTKGTRTLNTLRYQPAPAICAASSIERDTYGNVAAIILSPSAVYCAIYPNMIMDMDAYIKLVPDVFHRFNSPIPITAPGKANRNTAMESMA